MRPYVTQTKWNTHTLRGHIVIPYVITTVSSLSENYYIKLGGWGIKVPYSQAIPNHLPL